MTRLLLLVAVVVVLAGCGDSVPGGKVVTPTPVTVIGSLQKPPYEGGNASAGKALFSSALTNCATCHTYGPAGSTGTLGPNLDDLAAYEAKVATPMPLGQFVYQSIVSPPAPYVPPAFVHKETMPGTFGTSLNKKQLADLVAFLTQRS